MARVIIDQWERKIYRDDKNNYHREDGPAKIHKNGGTFWYKHGGPHDSYKKEPDMFDNGIRTWWKESFWCSDNRPAYDCPNGHKAWFEKGRELWPTFP